MPKVYIVGVGGDGAASLGEKALGIIAEAGLLCGGQRLLDCFPKVRALKMPIKSNLDELVKIIVDKSEVENIVVLASGDPNFYGIANYLVGSLGKEQLEIIPNISSMQLAFARIKESWDDAVLTSVHGRSIEEILDLVRSSQKTGILTDDQRTPGDIARMLLAQGPGDYRAFVCEDLGSDDERVIETDLAGLVGLVVSPLNVLILLKQPHVGETGGLKGPSAKLDAGQHGTNPRRQWSFGIPDDEFCQRRPLKGLITKAEVRVVSLSKMELKEDSVVWDVGAGSGSISVEAALVARRGQVYAVERNPDDAALVRRNLEKFGIANAKVIEGLAPEALNPLPDPDAVFIGGSGGQMIGILDVVCRRLKTDGRVVANIATVANLNSAVDGLAARGFAVEVTLVNIARSKGVSGLLRFEALDPVFIVSASAAPQLK